MGKVRVLIVDDAVVVRKIVSDVLAEDPGIEIVGTAANGRIALQKLTQVNPDLVTLDIEMPELDGLETLKALRKTHPRLPVIMFSTLTERGASATIEALTLGASDYVTKPANVGSVGVAQQRVRDELIPKIHALCPSVAAPKAPAPPVVARPAASVPPARPMPMPAVPAASAARVPAGQAGLPDIVAIGVSTGGPNALADIIPLLPGDFPVPIVITQHMPPMFTKFLADRLDGKSALEVREAAGGEELRPGVVYIAPGDYHMVLKRRGTSVVTALNQNPPENSCRPAVDVMFRSVHEVYGSAVLALILTGMGQDGLHGCEVIKAAGGSVLAQDEATSVVWGMPGFVARAGLADRVLPLGLIAGELVARTEPVRLRRNVANMVAARAARG
ncbi:MAG: chemotaxis response regulator protein-glutamate methylesterase [Vicinamibacterales bacterium]